MYLLFCCYFSVTQSCPTLCNPKEHSRLSCPSPSPRVCSDSYPLSRWCYLTISYFAVLFSFCLESYPSSGSFPMSWLFELGGQSIGASALASVFSMNIKGWFPIRLTEFDFLAVQGTFKSLLQHHSLKASVLQLTLLHGPALTSIHDYWKNHSFDYTDLCQQNDISVFKTGSSLS